MSKIVADWLRLVSPIDIIYFKQLESFTPNIHEKLIEIVNFFEDDLLYTGFFDQ